MKISVFRGIVLIHEYEELVKASAKKFQEIYNCDVSIELIDEIVQLK